MTVSTAYAPLSYDGNGATTAFTVTWQFFTGTLRATLIDADGVETVKSLTTHYTVSGGTDSNGLPATGTLTMLSAPASGTKLRIERVTPKTQAQTWGSNDAFPQKVVEAAIDRLTLQTQEAVYAERPEHMDIVEEASAPPVPPSGRGRFYVIDGELYFKNDAGEAINISEAVGASVAAPEAIAAAAAAAESEANAAASEAAAAASAALVDQAIENLETGVVSFNTRSGAVVLSDEDVVTALGYTPADDSAVTTALSGKAATSHTHAISDTTGLQTALDGKAASSHNHAATDITSGTVGTARLGSGTASSSTYLRGDSSWQAISGGNVFFNDQTSSSSASYPIGTCLVVNGNGTLNNRNSTVTVRLHDTLTGLFITAGSGSALTGTWRVCGATRPDLDNPGGEVLLCQRVA